MNGQVVQLPDGAVGFDANCVIDGEGARAWVERGHRFAVRYIRRQPRHDFDLNLAEVETLHDAGLALMPVQHVENPDAWRPTAVKGSANGNVAVEECLRVGVPKGVTVWCDLEGVAPGTPWTDVVEYCQQWFRAVRGPGYLPGLYIGWRCGLRPDQLYHNLSFQKYWSAYNTNADQFPEVRGVQMRQHALPNAERPVGYRNVDGIDADAVQRDKLGGLPTAWAPSNWAL